MSKQINSRVVRLPSWCSSADRLEEAAFDNSGPRALLTRIPDDAPEWIPDGGDEVMYNGGRRVVDRVYFDSCGAWVVVFGHESSTYLSFCSPVPIESVFEIVVEVQNGDRVTFNVSATSREEALKKVSVR